MSADLPPTQYLIMEVLAARSRTGEPCWTFPRTLRQALDGLLSAGLVNVFSSPAPGSLRVELTAAGRAHSLKGDFVPPITKQIIDVVEQAMRNASNELAEPMTPKAVEHGIGVALAINKVLAEVRRELGTGVTGSNAP